MNWKEILREDYKFIIIFIMLGVVMFWSYYTLGPVKNILEIEQNQTKGLIKIAEWIRDNQTEIQRKLDILLNMTGPRFSIKW